MRQFVKHNLVNYSNGSIRYLVSSRQIDMLHADVREDLLRKNPIKDESKALYSFLSESLKQNHSWMKNERIDVVENLGGY